MDLELKNRVVLITGTSIVQGPSPWPCAWPA